MPFVQAKCTNCGAILQVEKDRDAAICPYCQTPYIIEKAINTFKISNQFSISNSEVHIHNNDLSDEEKYEKAKTFLALKDYVRAEEKFESLVQTSPDFYKGWWGVVCAKTQEFTSYGVDSQEMKKLITYVQSSFKVCNDESICQNMKKEWDSYKKVYDEKWRVYEATNSHILSLKTQKNGIHNSIPLYEKKAKGNLALKIVGWWFILYSLIFTPHYFLDVERFSGETVFIFGIYVAEFFIGVFLILLNRKKKKDALNKLIYSRNEIQKIEQEISKINLNEIRPR